MKAIAEIMDEAGEWVSIDGVEGVGQGRQSGQDCIEVFVSCCRDDLDKKIPASFRGYPVVIIEHEEEFTIEKKN